MSIWEKTILNMEKGSKKITALAVTFSDRVKMEMALARLRIKIDEAQSRIDEQHRTIGKRIVSLSREGAMPESTDQLLKDDAIQTALVELDKREKEVADFKSDIENIRSDFKNAEKQTEDTLK